MIRPGVPRSLLFLALTLASQSALSGICRVSPDGSSTGDGQSWAAAMSLHAALTHPVCTEIWLKRGRHIPTTGAGALPYFQIPSGTRVYGGFAGTETARNQRRPLQNRSVLSGDLAGDDIVDSHGITSHWNNIVGVNACQVVRLTSAVNLGIGPDTVLDGLTITAGAVGTGENDRCNGAGLYCDGRRNSCSPTLHNLDIVGNRGTYGAGMSFLGRNSGAISPAISRTRFRNNHAAMSGGALHLDLDTVDASSTPAITGSGFTGNQAGLRGGAVAVSSFSSADHTSITVTGSNFDGNHSAIDAGAFSVIAQQPRAARVRISDTTFRNNTADRDCGAMELVAVAADAIEALIERVTFNDNHTQRDGGALCSVLHPANGTTPLTLRNATLANNLAGRSGGAWYNENAYGTTHVAVHVVNATLAGNQAGSEGGAISNAAWHDGIHMTLANSIVWNNRATTSDSDIYQESGQLAVRRSLIGDGCPSVAAPCDRVIGDPSLLPLADNGGPTRTMLAGAGGAGIGQGDAATCPDHDQRGVARPHGAGCDLGAVEGSDRIFADGFQTS